MTTTNNERVTYASPYEGVPYLPSQGQINETVRDFRFYDERSGSYFKVSLRNSILESARAILNISGTVPAARFLRDYTRGDLRSAVYVVRYLQGVERDYA